jgi:hypothetical protein
MPVSSEEQANERMSPGTHAPVYQGPQRDTLGGWRRQTPPIVEYLDETIEHVLAKQGRSDNRTPS